MTALHETYADKWAGPWEGPLTLRQREAINGTILRCQDAPGEPSCCFNCLADLPGDPVAQDAHVCGEETSPAEAPAPVPVIEHKTRTTQPSGYSEIAPGVRRFDKRGRVMHDRGSFWRCTCGAIGAGATRQEARSRARQHREAPVMAAV